jgi:sec-independent protein translocase protein TatA
LIGTPELVVILGLALLLFGPKKMPEIGRSLGVAMRELRRASNDFMSAIESSDREDPPYEPEEHFDDYEHEQAKKAVIEANSEPVAEHQEETHQPKEGV